MGNKEESKPIEEEESSPFEEIEQIKIARVRTFFVFESPSLVKTVEEITLFNDEIEETYYCPYDLGAYRTALHVYDSDGKSLEFHGNLDYDLPDEITLNYLNLIEIEFPEERPLLKNEYRTIKLEYITSSQLNELLDTDVNVVLYKGASTYSFIKECEGYEFIIHYTLYDDDGNELSPAALKTKKQPSFFEMCCTSGEIDGKVTIKVRHKIPDSVLNWYKLGLFFGISSSILVISAYIWDTSYIASYFVLSSITISFLVITKGWIFQKKMDKELIKYDSKYRKIVFIITLEIILMTLHYSGILSSIFNVSFDYIRIRFINAFILLILVFNFILSILT